MFDPSLSGDNLTYNLWNFGSLRIVVRCRIPCFVPEPAPPGFRYCCLQAKLDYLPALGPEDIASHEARHLWIYNYLRPGPIISHCRRPRSTGPGGRTGSNCDWGRAPHSERPNE